MKLVDTFMFSEAYETDALLIKLHCEGPVVHRWIIVENEYTFRGDHKGFSLAAILGSDPRFAPFLDRIMLIATSIRQSDEVLAAATTDTERERVYFQIEWAQREAARTFITNNYGDDDFMMVSDLDEVIDATTDKKRNDLIRIITNYGEKIISVPVIEYVYDYDCISAAINPLPIIPISMLKNGGLAIVTLRGAKYSAPVVPFDLNLGIGYRNCFKYNSLKRKYGTYSHVMPIDEELDVSLSCNREIQTKVRSDHDSIFHPRSTIWYDRISLTERDAPQYVLENLDSLRTGNIPDNYQENRARRYPHIFTPNTVKFTRTRGNYVV